MVVVQNPLIEDSTTLKHPDRSGIQCFINELPPELLSRIFALTIDSHSETSSNHWSNLAEESTSWLAGPETDEKGARGPTREDSSEPDSVVEAEPFHVLPTIPIIPSSVCRYWRDVALSTPSLWTAVVLCPVAGRSFKHVPMLLERSNTLPINIWINCDAYDFSDGVIPPSAAEFRVIFSMLIPHVHRWRTMHVSVSDYNLMHIFLSAVSDPSVPAAPQLTTLALYHDEELEDFQTFWYPCMSMSYTLFGGHAPLLSKIIFWGVHVNWDQPWIASASNLTELALAYHTEDVRPSWGHFASILRSAPALEKLTLCLSGPSGEPSTWSTEPLPEAHGTLIQLLRLTEFDLSYRSPECAIGLLRRLYLPSLKGLVLEFLDGDYTNFVHELAGPATCPSSARERPLSVLSKLTRLELTQLPCRENCVEMLYGELQNLTSLRLAMEYLPTLFLSILSKPCTLTDRSGVWLPRLTTLYATGVSDIADMFCGVVRKRREAGAPLSTLYLDKHSGLQQNHMDDLRETVTSIWFFGGF